VGTSFTEREGEQERKEERDETEQAQVVDYREVELYDTGGGCGKR
jgi:hypothetical protein